LFFLKAFMLLSKNGFYTFDEFELDAARRRLLRGEESITLTPKAFDVLSYLVLNPGRVVTKDELLKAVWPDSFVEEGNLAQYVSALRRALGEKSSLIVTVPGRGYQFTGQVQTIQSEAALTAPAQSPIDVEVLPDAQPGDVLVQRVRERTRIVYEDAPAALQLPAPTPHWAKLWRWTAAAALGSALLTLALVYAWRHYRHPPQISYVVLADFINQTGDPNFDFTLDRALQIDLEQSPYLNLLPRQKVKETLIQMQRKGDEPLTPELAVEICERNNAQAVLHGDLASFGSKYLLTISAESCVNGKEVAGFKAQAGSKEEILGALDTAASRVRKQLGESAATLGKFQTPIAQATTSSLEALRAYSQAMESGDRGDFQSEQTLLELAIALDPNFASAYRGLSDNYFRRRDFPQAAAMIRKAYDLRARATERERLTIEIAYYSNGNFAFEDAIASLRLYNQVYPNDAAKWFSLCEMYAALGEYPQAIEAGEHAYRMAPHSGTGAEILARAYRKANRFNDAKRVARAAIAEGKELWGLHSTLFQIAFAENDAAAMKAETDWGFAHQQLDLTLANLGFAAASGGKIREASEYFSRARQEALKDGDTDFADGALLLLAPIYVEIGDLRGADTYLRRMKGDESDPGTKAFFQAEVGDQAPARKLIAAIESSQTKNTLSIYFDLPMLRALLALKAHHPAEAVQEMEPARNFQMRDYGVPFQRARMEAEAGMLDAAAADYRLILANPGIGPIWTDYTLAHLQLARVLARQNKAAEARQQYQAFFVAWKDADANLPILQAANREFARLQ
jgi:DNA-binding winged helix-turn-helix (wHTH) protein